MTTLRDLLQRAADQGLSTRAMEKRVAEAATDSGVDMAISRGTASLILSGKHRHNPSDATIRAIAFLSGAPERVAFEAAGRKAPSAPFREELPDGVDQLSPKRRRVALEVIRSLVEAEELEHRLAATQDDEQMSDLYLPDGTLNEERVQFARADEDTRVGLVEHLRRRPTSE
ncbi:hypothetical protein [Nocardia asiatica]|uniref:hypothetical protein n=1 Tax=Nocardia asiatica TaxID=209252 RepID=UPI002455CA0C|nr:hypothetical protein [Nocardia asiatica]